MKGFFKKAKTKARGVVEGLRPPSRQGSPSPAPSSQSIPTHVTNAATIPATPGFSAAQPASSSSAPATPATPGYARPSTPPSALATTGSVVYGLLIIIRDGSDMCLPLKAAVVGVLAIWDVCEHTVQINQEFVKHKEKLERLLKITTTYKGESRLSDNLQERLKEVAAALESFAHAVQAKLDRGLPSRVLQSGNDIAEVKALVDKIMSLIDVFQFEGGILVEIGVERVKSGIEQIQRGVDQVEDGIGELQDRVEKAQYGVDQVKEGVDQIKDGVDQVQSGVGQIQDGVEDVKLRLSTAEWERLKSLIATALSKHHVPQAVYDAQQRSGCMQGTRVVVLDHVSRWIMDPKAQPIFWLGGMAGTGKTSIAESMCEWVQAEDALCLGGSFFCSRSTGLAAQRDVRCVIPTLAQLLARQSDEFAVALSAELQEEPDLAYKQVKVQVERLLCKPLTALSSSTKPIVFIVDALDECGDQPTDADNSKAHAAVGEMLEALIDFSRSSTGLPIKFIVTSRPETHIRETSVTDIKVTSALHLHMIDKTQVTSDIHLYITETLSKAPATKSWFTNDHVNTLAERADGLFIFAATATKYILGGGRAHRGTRLINLVSSLQAMPTDRVVAPLDDMYSSILLEASSANVVNDDELQQMLKIVATILSARMSLSVDALAELLDLSTEYIRGCLDRLHAVVYLPEDDHEASLRTLHASFGDYLFTRAAPGIRIKPTLGHDELARGCFHRMKQDDFGFNISQSPSSHEPNPKTVPDCISLSLRYACLHWAHHVQCASVPSAFDGVVNSVFRRKFLFWLEVLSVLGEICRACGLLRIAGFVVKSAEVSQFLRDANSFVASSRAAIEWSAPHIYLSAFPFAPKESLVFQDFASLLRGVVSVETFGIDRHGGRLVMNLTGHKRGVNSVAYSPNGRLLVSGSTDGTVRLWNTLAGEETMAPLQSGDGAVLCLAFAADGQRIVSGTDSGAVHIWDAHSGRAAMRPLRGHSGAVRSLAVSRDGLIASASEDRTVRLWDVATGQAIAVLVGHDGEVWCVAFSSDGHTLASGSQDSTVRLWDVHTHDLRRQPLRGVADCVWSVAVSLDGTLIAAAYSAPHEVHIWSMSTGELIGASFKAESSIYDLAFAPNGSCLALTNSHDIRFWDWNTGQDVAPALSGHSSIVTSISYSPDGLYIATASYDRTILIWDAEHSQTMTQRLPSHTGKIHSVTVSADGSFIASGSADRTIRVWDSQTAEPILRPLTGHSDEVLSIAVSADSQFIASGSADCTVRLWNAQTGEPVGESLEGHGDRVNAVAFSYDVQWLASASDDETVGLWAISGDQHPTLHQLHCPSRAFSVAFSSHGQLLAAGDYFGCVTVFDLSTGGDDPKFATKIVSSSGVISVCFSPDNSKVVAASVDSNAYVWDIATDSVLQTLEGHQDRVRAVAYSPDGERLATANNDCTVQIWDATTSRSITTLRGHVTDVSSVAFFPDGKSLVSGAYDGTIRLWDVTNSAAPSSEADPSPIDILCQARQEDGWLVSGSSSERLVWLPQEYRANVIIGKDCTTLIASYRVAVSADIVLYHGTEWAACWRGARSSITTNSAQPA